MCVRTKTSYDCGHVFKSTNGCYASACTAVERYHYLKEGDCRECRREGSDASVVRGREGKGRYVQRIKRSRIKDRPDTSDETISAEYDVVGASSPWAPQTRPAKTWESPHRKQADEAWLSEHDDRLSDLQDRLQRVKLSDRHSQPTFSKEVVVASEDYDCDDYNDYDQDEYVFVQETPTRKHTREDGRRHMDDRVERSHSHRHQGRQYSHDSLPDSMPSYRSSPKMRKASTFNVVNAYPEATYEYDYYSKPNHVIPKDNHKRHHYQHQPPVRSISNPHYTRRSHEQDSDYRIGPVPSPPPPLQMPPPTSPAIYDTYEYYSPGASPATAGYTFSEYPYEINHPIPPRPQRHINYPRY